MSSNVPDRTIERLVLGELDANAAAELRADQSVREREAALSQSNDDILRSYPPERMAEQITRRAVGKPRRRLWLVLGSVAVAALVIARLLPEDDPTERAKGSVAMLGVWKKTQGAPERLSDGARVTAGDVVQITYNAGAARYGIIASLDGAGVVTVHWPVEGDYAAALDHHGPMALPTAYALDAAPGFERFVLVSAQQPFSVARVRHALTALSAAADGGQSGRLDLPQVLSQTSVLLLKVL